ncbi:MAG: hypothetical protein US16_C0027G0005 [Candidatus Moranbacteria bacterium GW2011_GWE2_36_40]|nr:MAG: hypothetical protein US16_C0027G0005 [Candidatus Moranbacteria bacterium GW2011_GWE2_36_40]
MNLAVSYKKNKTKAFWLKIISVFFVLTMITNPLLAFSAPTISGITLSSGLIIGGDTVTITGTGFLVGSISATGGTITTDGDYTVHTFTTNGTFTADASLPVEVLVVAGGGGSAGGYEGGAGGGGGVQYHSGWQVSAGTPVGVTVGTGGAAGPTSTNGTNGGNSAFDSLIANGGGGGGNYAGGAGAVPGSGGSGGGASRGAVGGTSNQGSVNGSTSYGHAGGNGPGGGGQSGGGGGGAGAIGGNTASSDTGGVGGVGIASSISGASTYYGGGGGGSSNYSTVAGGNGGGGTGGSQYTSPTAGTANTGGGGGGERMNGIGKNGGSGIVIVRYLTNSKKPTVTIGGVAATNIVVVNSTTITATTPAHTAGVTDVVVTNYDGQSAILTNGYTYNYLYPAPVVSGLNPSSGAASGGTIVNITGTGFVASPVTATGGTITTDGNYTVHTFTTNGTFTADASLPVEVLVAAGGGGSGGGPESGAGGGGGVQHHSSWSVASGSPNNVVVGGGGGGGPYMTNGTNGTSSSFGSLIANGGGGGGHYGAGSGSVPGSGGSGGGASRGSVGGTSNQSSIDGSTSYGHAGGNGPGGGGTSGGGGGGAGSVGGNGSGGTGGVGGIGVASSISGVATYYGGGGGGASDGSSVAGGAGGGGTGGSSSVAPTVGTPNTGGGGGGERNPSTGKSGGSGIVVVRYLTNSKAPTVTIGGTPATNVSVTSSTTITATAPAHVAGTADVVVTNYDGQSSTLTNGYTFNPAPTITTGAVSPSSAKITGGDTITITGTGFYGTPSVTFGGTAATGVTVVNPTTLTVITPAHVVGQVNVVVINPDSQSATLANGFTFTELPPTLSSISPDNGPIVGGTNVTINGSGFFPKNTGGDVGWGIVAGKILPTVMQASKAVSVGNSLYLFGGHNGITTTNAIYTAPLADPTTWTDTGKTLPSTSTLLSSLAIIDNNLYLFGGYNGAVASSAIFTASVADPTTWTVVSEKTLPAGLFGAQFATVGENIYLFGGHNGTAATNVIYTATISDPTTWSVVSGKVLPQNVYQSQIIKIENNLYLFGGYNGSSWVNTIYTATASDPTTWSVVSGKTLPGNLGASQLINIGDKLYLLGGYNGSSVNSIYTATISDPTTWTVSSSVLPENLQGSAVLIIDNYVYLFSGYTTTYVNKIYRAPLSHFRGNVYNNSWITNWPTVATDQTNVVIGGAPATNINFTNSTTITATASAHVAAMADVVVTNYDGQSATLAGAYEYRNWITRGTYTSTVKSSPGTLFGTINWNASIPVDTAVVMRVKSCTTADCSDKPSWTGCDLASIDNGTDISGKGCVVDGQQYVQYQAYLTTDSASVNPYLDSVTIYDQPQYATTFSKMISSPYNTGDLNNAVSKIVWNATNDNPVSEGQVAMQIRTAPDNGSGVPDWTNSTWCGPTDCAAIPNSTSSFATSYYTDKVGATAINSINRDAINDQWVEYATFLKSANGSVKPTLSDVTLSYVVNAPPELRNVAAVQENDGAVTVAYDVRDPDTSTGATVNKVNVSLEYCSANCGNIGSETWTQATNVTGDAGADIAVAEVDWSSGYQLSWNAKADYPNQFNNTNFKVRLKADDGEGANNTKTSEAAVSVFDTKNPVAGALPIIVDATTSPANVTLSASDDSAFEMKVSTSPTLSGANWEAYNTIKTITLATAPATIYVQFKDAYGNASAILNVTTPEVPASVMIQDVSNMHDSLSEYRLFAAWKVAVSPTPGFGSYKVYRSLDQSTWTLSGTITDRLTNYYVDKTVSGDTNYYYKITTNDVGGNISAYSNVLNGKANGLRDAGEDSGAEQAPPSISNVTIDQITNVSARINWTTNTLSSSTVGYSTTAGNFAQEVGTNSMTTSHSVIVGSLSPNTKYYFQVKSVDSLDSMSVDFNGGNGYDFTTAVGDSVLPIISNINVAAKTSSTATINWNTDENATSFVEYSKTDGFGTGALFGNYTLTTSHSVVVPSLEANATYYFKVHSKDASNNESVSSQSSFVTDPSGDVVAPIVSDISVTSSFNSALVSWTTDENSNSYVEFGITTGYGRIFGHSTLTMDHNVQLPADLIQNTTYHYRIHSTDGSGNESISLDGTFLTEMDVADVTAPNISNIAVGSPASTSVSVTWNTNENATSFIGYSLDGGNTFSQQGNSVLATSHSITLVGLTSSTNYLLKIISTDASGNTATDDNSGQYYAIATPSGSQVPVLSSITTSAITYDQATITWNTNNSATSFVEYGLDNGYGNAVGKYATSTSHSIQLKNLLAGQTYHFRVRSIDQSEAVSGDYTFSTQAAPDSAGPIVANIVSTPNINKTQIMEIFLVTIH